LNFDFTLCQIPGINSHFFFIITTYSFGEIQSFTASKKYFPAPSIAQPNLGPIVASPEISPDFKSFPAREVIIVLVAPETAGQWSAKSMIIVFINLRAYSGKSLLSHKFPITFAILPFCMYSEIGFLL
jgi:hypothetical protein